MLLKVFNASGEALPLVDVKNGRIEHLEDGCDKLIFSLDVRHPIYKVISEETSIHYGDNAWLVKKIQDDAIECEIDFDFLKAEIKHGYKYQNQLITKVLIDNLPSEWTIIGAKECTKHRGKSYEHCTPYEAIYDCISKYDVRFVWKTLKKTLEIRVPEKIGTHGVYLSDQLNLKSLAFQGSSTDFATRLYAYGANGMTFADINDGKDYVENTNYKAKTVCAYWVDERYEQPLSLLEAAYEKLEAMAKPERSYECQVQDLEKQNHEEYEHLTLRMHDKITLMVAERSLRVVYSIVKYVEYPDDPNSNTVTLSCVPETIQSYTQALVKANVEDAIITAEKALAKTDEVSEKVNSVADTVEKIESDVVAADEKAQKAFNRAESAFLEAETVGMDVKEVVKGLAVPSDPYYCGDKSPTYGRTQETAAAVMEDGIIFVPTETHAESLDGGTEYSFARGKSYIWQNGGWQYLSEITFADAEKAEAEDGDLWYCTATHTADGVEYKKDTLYRRSTKDGNGLWVAKASKTDEYVYKSINSLLESVVSITADVKDNQSKIELLTAWKTEATQSITDVTQKADANEANISVLLTFMGDTESGAIKAIAELQSTVEAHESKIESIVAWIGDTESGAIKAIADVTQKADANAATIETLVSWVGDSGSGATKAIADIKATADANTGSIQTITSWQETADSNISSLRQKSDAQSAEITSLTQKVSDNESAITEISQKTENNTASISVLTKWKSDTDSVLSEVQTNIAAIGAEADENSAKITALVTTNEKAFALSKDKYVVGRYSPTYGYTNSPAEGIMETGTIYVPTFTHAESYISAESRIIHDAGVPASDRSGATILEAGMTDRYAANIIDCGDPSARVQTGANIVFELGYLYTWKGEGWVKGDTVSLYTAEQTGVEGELWYCQKDITETTDGTGVGRTLYSSGTLYKCVGESWVAVADICNNYAQMAAAMIEMQVSSITARVTDAEGNIAALSVRVTEAETHITQLTEWKTSAGVTIAATEAKANANEANITTLATWKSSVEDDVSSIASISAKADANEAQIALKADKTSTLTSADVYYALSDSNTTAPETGWQTVAPAWENGKYMWQKTILTYANGETSESDATCITGASGADGKSITILGSYESVEALKSAHPTGSEGDGYLVNGYLYVWNNSDWENVGQIQGPAGAQGTGISSIQEQYYLSSSNATQTGGSWVETCPTWVSGKYIWTRSKIDWTDGTTSYTTATLAQALNQFGASIEINTQNILLKVDSGKIISTINQSAEAVSIDASKINISGLITAINGNTTTTIDGGKITTGSITAEKIDATNLHVKSANIDGEIVANSLVIRNTSGYVLINAAGNTVNIGDFTVARNSARSYICYGKTTKSADSTVGVYIGTDGISVGGVSDGNNGHYNVTLDGSTGKLTANNADITGTIRATAGTLGNLTVTGRLSFGNNSSYFIDPNYGNTMWYIYLKNFKVDENNAYFGGCLQAPSGTIGGWTIETTKLKSYKDGMGTGFQIPSSGTWAIAVAYTTENDWSTAPFRVSHSGELYATNAYLSGTFSNKKSKGYGISISGSMIEFYDGSSQIGYLRAGTGYIPWDGSIETINGIACSSLFCADGGIRCGGSLQLSTGNWIYVSGKKALPIGQLHVQTDSFTSRYLLIYNGLIVGVSDSKYDFVNDYSKSTYTG